MDLNATTLAGAQANVLETAKFQAAFRNRDEESIYLTTFNNWKLSVEAGRISNANPPLPPPRFEVVVGKDGWAFVERGNEPVCAVPEIPEDRSKTQAEIKAEAPEGTIDVGGSADNGAGVWFVAGPRDRVKPGTTVTLPMGRFLRIGYPFGNGYYQKVG